LVKGAGNLFLRISGLIIVAATLFVGGCGVKKGEEANSYREYAITDINQQVVEASNQLGLRLYGELSQKQQEKNVFLSPISISTALALVLGGADGLTAEEMKQALGLDAVTLEQTGHGYHLLLDLLSHPEDDGIKLNVANSLWMRKGKSFHNDFVKRSQEDYGAEVSQLDFSSSKAVKTMNSWVENHTNGKIKEIVKEINDRSMLFVLNAVYFNGAWSEPFPQSATSKSKFHLWNDETISVDMMSKGGRFEYSQEDGYDVVRLPFGKGESASMVIFLPEAGIGALNKVQEKIVSNPKLLTAPLEVRPGRVELPKVEFSYSVELKDVLKVLGINEAFNEMQANFSRMAPEPPNLFISMVEHKTFLAINEQGTEAAAVTKVEMMAGSAQPVDPFNMSINHPFIVAIVDHETGTILFVGTVMNPISQ